jgi:hypothetical protein
MRAASRSMYSERDSPTAAARARSTACTSSGTSLIWIDFGIQQSYTHIACMTPTVGVSRKSPLTSKSHGRTVIVTCWWSHIEGLILRTGRSTRASQRSPARSRNVNEPGSSSAYMPGPSSRLLCASAELAWHGTVPSEPQSAEPNKGNDGCDAEEKHGTVEGGVRACYV